MSLPGVTFAANIVYFSSLVLLMAIGLVLIFSILDVINFTHAAFFSLGAYLTYAMVSMVENPVLIFASFIVAAVVVGLVGIAFEMSMLRYTYEMGHEYQILLTFGGIFLIEGIIRVIWGSSPLFAHRPSAMLGSVGGYPVYNLFIILLAVVTLALLWYLLFRTRFGMETRSVASNEDAALSLGIDVRRVQILTFGVASALAGLAGALAMPLAGARPLMGIEPLVLSFIVIVVGGLRSLRGAVVGAFIVGGARIFGVRFFPDIELAIAYIVLAAFLIMLPEGIFGGEGT